MPRRSPAVIVADWPPTLRHLIRAAEAECPEGHAEALRELTALAIRKVPARGIFEPGVRGEPEMFTAIEAIARAHLEFAEARTAFRSALERAGLDLALRDDIEQGALLVQTISDTAYFYTGLAFGVAFSCAYRS